MNTLRSIIASLLIFGLFPVMAQNGDVIIRPKTRHRFAQSGFGIFNRVIPAYVSSVNTNTFFPDGKLHFPGYIQPVMSMSGMHFWGKIDFYIHIPLSTIALRSTKLHYNPGVETGVKYFLYKTPYTSVVSPFVGISFNSINFSHENGSQFNRVVYPMHVGLASIFKDRHYIELSLSYFRRHQFDYYFSRSEPVSIGHAPALFKVGYRFIIDTTLSAEDRHQSGKTAKIVEVYSRKGGLNSFTFGVGVSSAFDINQQNSFIDKHPFLGKQAGTGVFLELGLGYYHHDWDAHLNFSYRSSTKSHKGHRALFELKRELFTVDIYKFIADYHGFVPFVGISPGIDFSSIRTQDGYDRHGVSLKERNAMMGLIFGWDIRPNRLQAFTLRTNLRYYPFMNRGADTVNLSFSQLEINFIQIVFNINRMIK